MADVTALFLDLGNILGGVLLAMGLLAGLPSMAPLLARSERVTAPLRPVAGVVTLVFGGYYVLVHATSGPHVFAFELVGVAVGLTLLRDRLFGGGRVVERAAPPRPPGAPVSTPTNAPASTSASPPGGGPPGGRDYAHLYVDTRAAGPSPDGPPPLDATTDARPPTSPTGPTGPTSATGATFLTALLGLLAVVVGLQGLVTPNG